MAPMGDLLRREIINTARTLVIKIGTNVLSRADDSLNTGQVAQIAEQIHHVIESGRQVVVISSGAVGAGIGLLRLAGRPVDLPHLQAAAAAGQAHLIRVYDECFKGHGYHAAQLLLTIDDFQDRRRYLNVRNTLNTLFEYHAVPVINENDTISVDEIRFGDNDRLAAMVANSLPSSLLVMLSVVDGLYDGNPQAAGSKLIPLVEQWDDRLLNYATEDATSRGTGGMRSKLEAVRIATAVGENVIIAGGHRPDAIDRILAGEEVGTLFLAQGASVPAWKRWIGYTVSPRGRLLLDDGARAAIQQAGRSLLAIGITGVEGDFTAGALVALVDNRGNEFARGLTNYGSADARRIMGKRTEEITGILGDLPYGEVIHRDNLVVIGQPDH